MTKQEHLKFIFDTFHHDIDSAFERLKVKYSLLFMLKNNNQRISVSVTDPLVTKVVLQINYSAGEIGKNYTQMETECRRIYISDLYSICSNFCISASNVLNGSEVNGRYDAAFINKQYSEPLNLLNKFLSSDNKEFLKFFHKVRNSMIHYDGQYNRNNLLDYRILSLVFKTTDENLGEQIIWGVEEKIELYKIIKNVFQYEKFAKNPLFHRS